MASFLGLRRRWAAEFSFLIAAPAIVAGTLLKIKDTLDLPSDKLTGIAWGSMILGSLVSFVVGIIALKLLLITVRRARLHWFAPYCLLLGAVVLVAQ